MEPPNTVSPSRAVNQNITHCELHTHTTASATVAAVHAMRLRRRRAGERSGRQNMGVVYGTVGVVAAGAAPHSGQTTPAASPARL